MKWRKIIPLSFTLSAILAGFFSMVMSAAGEYLSAAQFIMLAMILDGLDGTFARLLKATSAFGADLDTFCDMTSFGLAPALLAYEAALKSFGIWGVLIASAIVLSGALRLARFRIIDPFRGQKGFLGLPITVNGGWIALFVFATEAGLVDESWFTLRHGPLATFVWASVLAMVFLQVSHVRYTKPTKDPVFLASSVMLVVFLFLKIQLAVAAALTMNAWGFIYAFISPLYHRRHPVVVVTDEAEDEEEEEPVHLRRL